MVMKYDFFLRKASAEWHSNRTFYQYPTLVHQVPIGHHTGRNEYYSFWGWSPNSNCPPYY